MEILTCMKMSRTSEYCDFLLKQLTILAGLDGLVENLPKAYDLVGIGEELPIAAGLVD